MRRSLLAVSILLAASCATRQPMTGQVASDVDRKLSTFAFIEEASSRRSSWTRVQRATARNAHVPGENALANRGVKQLSLTRESFTLTDENGNRYPCASPRELLANYDFLDLDRNLAELGEIVFNRFGAMTAYPSKFSPTRRPSRAGESTVVTDNVQLPKFGYLLDMLYFPMPTTGLVGHKFELALSAPELADPIFVKFEVK
jgi:hypothetical protein